MNIYWIHTRILCFVAIIQIIGKGFISNLSCDNYWIVCYILIVKFKTGLIGAAIASNIAYFLAILILFRYLTAKRYDLLHPNVWHRFNQDSIKYLGEYLQQG